MEGRLSARLQKKISNRIPFLVRPMLATLEAQPFNRPGWDYEEKYDGYRILARGNGKTRELTSYPKTSGGEGLHVFVPIRSGPDNDEVLAFAREICRRIAVAYPNEVTTAARISHRRKRGFLDTGRNVFAQTVVLPYSVRVRQHAPVSTTLDWSRSGPRSTLSC
jgi:hypothetical protein